MRATSRWRKGDFPSGIEWLLVIVGGLIVLGLFLANQGSLIDTAMSIVNVRVGNLLAGVGG